jgi:hypothetical protein
VSLLARHGDLEKGCLRQKENRIYRGGNKANSA